MQAYILAHDLGTSGDKATLFDEEGTLVASATTPYPTHYFNGNWAEQESEDWWRAVAESSRRIAAGIDPRLIKAIGFSGQMMGCVCVDAQGRSLRPAPRLEGLIRATVERAAYFNRPAPRAHLYFAPSTATGISGE